MYYEYVHINGTQQFFNYLLFGIVGSLHIRVFVVHQSCYLSIRFSSSLIAAFTSLFYHPSFLPAIHYV